MKKVFFIGVVCLLVGAVFLFRSDTKKLPSQVTQLVPSNKQQPTDSSVTTVIAENLDTPWGITFVDDHTILVTERMGNVRVIADGKLDPTPVFTFSNVKEVQESGLLGIAAHPDFAKNHFVYLYYTYSSTGNNTVNRVVRMTYHDKKLTDEKVIVDKIPGASNHNGGRIKFGNNLLYIGTGDAENPSQAQDKNTLGGKILRVTDEGKAAPDNPFHNLVYSYGHRNVQGLAWNKDGYLWATEHGRSGIQSGLDELNLILSGANYGWPILQGDQQGEGIDTPRKNSGSTTWAPAGAAFVGNSLFFGGLRGQTLYEAVIKNGQVTTLKEHFNAQYGRIREVILGPDGMLYITTSNKDGRGIPQNGDDKVIRVNPTRL